jgi:hypothetical protein
MKPNNFAKNVKRNRILFVASIIVFLLVVVLLALFSGQTNSRKDSNKPVLTPADQTSNPDKLRESNPKADTPGQLGIKQDSNKPTLANFNYIQQTYSQFSYSDTGVMINKLTAYLAKENTNKSAADKINYVSLNMNSVKLDQSNVEIVNFTADGYANGVRAVSYNLRYDAGKENLALGGTEI